MTAAALAAALVVAASVLVLVGGDAVAERWALRLDSSPVGRTQGGKAYGINS